MSGGEHYPRSTTCASLRAMAVNPRSFTPKPPSARSLRIGSGLILFAFATTHLLNHALGLISIDAMNAAQEARTAITRSWPGTTILLAAALVHMLLGIGKFLQRRNWRGPWGAVVQLGFGLLIPLLLARHIIGTRIAHQLYGVDDNYTYALFVMWPNEAWRQGALIVLVWGHGIIGLHAWLRLKPWYARWQVVLAMLAALIPALAFAGFAVAGREVRLTGDFVSPFTDPAQIATLYTLMTAALWGYAALLAALVALRLLRDFGTRLRPRLQISYAGGRVIMATPGATLLEMSLANGVPHAAICGGRGRCSTCRVRVVAGYETLDPPDEMERRVLARVGAGDHIRLACQMRPKADLTVMPLLPAQRTSPRDLARLDKYHSGVEQVVTLMFTDIRGFTKLTEHALAYDIVFLLNLYLGQMSEAVTDAGGYVDKFMGDGLMAIFGMDAPPGEGARSALAAARAMGGVLEALNQTLHSQLSEPLRIGIGLHTGLAVLGRVGAAANHDAGNRISALGDTVNTASRVESACKDLAAQLVLTEATRIAAGLGPLDGQRHEIVVKGRDTSVVVYAFARALDLEAASPPLPTAAQT